MKRWCRIVVALLSTAPLAAVAAACKPKPSKAPTSDVREGTGSLPLAPKRLDVETAPRAASASFDPVVQLLGDQLQQSFAALQKLSPAAYFLGYQVVERKGVHLTASDGAVVSSDEVDARFLDVDVRIGSLERDNTHPIPDEGTGTFKVTHPLPLDYGQGPMKNAIWLATDREYDAALARWLRVEALDQQDEPDEARPDFSSEPPSVFAEQKLETPLDTEALAQLLSRASSVGLEYPEIQRSQITLGVSTETRYQATSEGTKLQTSRRSIRIELQAQTTAEDGMVLDRFDSIELRSLDALPPPDDLAQRFRTLFQDVRALRDAPVIEPYVGPAILDGKAAGVFFHEVFGHRIEGHRQDAEHEGQTFASMVGQQIMLASLSIYDDPTISRLNGVDLNGFYLFDDEGVPAQRANLIEAGVLRGFLLSRAPARGFHHSNGHGRREPGHAVVARQANLVIDPAQTVSRETLERALLAEVSAQQLPHGLRFAEISGGFTQTQRYDTQAFKVIPVMVYKIYPDGREQLVRGVDIEGTPLTALSKIALAANDFEVFNGVCGAESGWVPVSATSPSMLLSQIEVARKEQGDAKPPLLPPPQARVQGVVR